MSLTSEPAVIVDLTVVRDVKLSVHRQGQDPPGPFGGAMVLTLMPIQTCVMLTRQGSDRLRFGPSGGPCPHDLSEVSIFLQGG